MKRVLQVLPRRRLAGAAGLGLLLAGCDKLGLSPKPAASFRGADISGAEFGRSLSLPDVNGQARSLSDFKGKVTLVFFGYTQCPDVCPTTMSELAQIKKTLGPDGDRLQGVFITVDPERDTPAILKTYVASFDPSFVALRGTLAQTEAAAKEFKVYFAKVPGKVEGSYTMDHSAGAYLLDAQARPRVFARYGAGTDGLEADIRTLIAQS